MTDFWDALMFGFTASLVLLPDVSMIDIAMLIVIVAGTALGSAK